MAFMVNILIFLLGVAIGSFLNCVLYRLEIGKSFLHGRSYCPNCKHTLAWTDLIPVISFLWLQGKCRYCGNRISLQYPLVEIATGMVFLLIFNFQFLIFNQFSIIQFLNLTLLLYVVSSLIIIFVYDLKHYVIPDSVLFPAIIVAFLYRILDFRNLNLFRISDFGFFISTPLINYLVASFLASVFFLLIFLVSKGQWMGFGDVKLALLLGFILGFPNILLGLFLAFLFGAIIGIGCIILDKKGLKSEMPFAPFLIVGTLVALFWGGQMIDWYIRFLIF